MTTLSSSHSHLLDGTQLAFGTQTPSLYERSDTEFLQLVAWKPSSARGLRELLTAEDSTGSLEPWAQHLFALAGARPAPSLARVAWSRDAFPSTPRSELLWQALKQAEHSLRRTNSQSRAGSSKKTSTSPGKAAGRSCDLLREWIAEYAITPQVEPLESLLLLELLAVPPVEEEAGIYVSLWRIALTTALILSRNLDEPAGTQAPPDQRLVILGELPWRMGVQFAGVSGSGVLRRHGSQTLNRELLELTDTDGMPHAALLPHFPLWIASAVRSAALAESADQELWTKQSRQRLRQLLEHAAMLYRPDCRLALSNGATCDTLPMLQQAMKLAGLRKSSRPRKYLRALEKPSSAKADGVAQRKSGSVAQSDWAHVAFLRDSLSADANVLAVSHHDAGTALDLTCRGIPVLQGLCETTLRLDGTAVPLEGSWSCVCWHNDRDVDYLELQFETPQGVRVDRQILLSRYEDFLVFADVVCGAGDQRVDYQLRLPLAAQLTAKSHTETREIRLRNGKIQTRVYPLFLPDERGLGTPGNLAADEESLIVSHVSAGTGLYAPLVLDWSAERKRKSAEWRQLTVSEDGRVLSRGIAAGHRLMVGKLHLLIYRSLTEVEQSRTVLGHHTMHETVIGRFTKQGEVDPLLLVE